jgi:hypothetical protein
MIAQKVAHGLCYDILEALEPVMLNIFVTYSPSIGAIAGTARCLHGAMMLSVFAYIVVFVPVSPIIENAVLPCNSRVTNDTTVANKSYLVACEYTAVMRKVMPACVNTNGEDMASNNRMV